MSHSLPVGGHLFVVTLLLAVAGRWSLSTVTRRASVVFLKACRAVRVVAAVRSVYDSCPSTERCALSSPVTADDTSANMCL